MNLSDRKKLNPTWVLAVYESEVIYISQIKHPKIVEGHTPRIRPSLLSWNDTCKYLLCLWLIRRVEV